MADTIPGSELTAPLASIADAHGVKTTSIDDRTLSGTQEAITSKWFLGGRKVVYRMTCHADEASRTDRSVGGGGHLDYGGLRATFEQAVRAGSWQFTVDVGKMP